MKKFISLILFLILIVMVCLKIGNIKKSSAPKMAVVDIEHLIKKDSRYPYIKNLSFQQQDIIRMANIEISLKVPPPGGVFEEILRNRISLLAQSYESELKLIEEKAKMEEKRLIESFTKKIKEELQRKEKELKAKLTSTLKKKEGEIASQLNHYKKSLEEKYYLPRFNLKMKLETLSLSENEKNDLQMRLKHLEQQEKKEMDKKKEELLKELKEFQRREEENIIKELLTLKQKKEESARAEIEKTLSARFEQAKNRAIELKSILQKEETYQDKILMDAKRMAYPSKRWSTKAIIKNLQKIDLQRQKMVDAIKEDIISIVEQIAKERDYSVVISKWFLNISAPDLTKEIEEVIK